MQHIIPLFFKYAELVSSPLFLKVVRLHMICKCENYIFVKKSPFIIKTIVKTSLHVLRMKIIRVRSQLSRKSLCIAITVGCCIQHRFFVKGCSYIFKQGSENRFNMIFTHAICCNSRVYFI